MKHIHFLYGNQPFEIEEEVKSLTRKLLPDIDLKEAVFSFDVEDFFSKDQNQNSFLLSEFKNTLTWLRAGKKSFSKPISSYNSMQAVA